MHLAARIVLGLLLVAATSIAQSEAGAATESIDLDSMFDEEIIEQVDPTAAGDGAGGPAGSG